SEVENHVLLGDLHLKQGRARDAITAYQKAIELNREMMEKKRRVYLDLHGLPLKDVQGRLSTVELHSKLAQAYLAMGAEDKALETLKNVSEYAREAEALAQTPTGPGEAGLSKPAPATTTVPLPPKLVISVSKKLLDQAGSGKIGFEAFRKAASVE